MVAFSWDLPATLVWLVNFDNRFPSSGLAPLANAHWKLFSTPLPLNQADENFNWQNNWKFNETVYLTQHRVHFKRAGLHPLPCIARLIYAFLILGQH